MTVAHSQATAARPRTTHGAVPVAAAPHRPASAAPHHPNSASGDDGLKVVITLADGRTVAMPLREALRAGVVTLTPEGTARFTDATRQALTTGAAGAAVAGAVQGADGLVPAQGTADAHATQTLGAEGEKKSPLAAMGTAASAALLARGVLRIAQGPGMPTPETLWYAALGVNKFTGKKFVPEFLQDGPVRDIIDIAIPAKALAGSLPEIPNVVKQVKANMVADPSHTGIGGLIRAMLKRNPAEAAHHAAKPAGKPNVDLPFVTKFFPLIDPLYKFAFTLIGAAGALGMPEYMREHGLDGLLTTTSGRGALLGALSGVSILGSVWMPASPLQMTLDIASNVLWMAEEVNGKGWLDPLLGGDKPEEKKLPAAPATDPSASQPASTTTVPAGNGAQAAPGGTRLVPVAPAVPTVSGPASPRRARKARATGGVPGHSH